MEIKETDDASGDAPMTKIKDATGLAGSGEQYVGPIRWCNDVETTAPFLV